MKMKHLTASILALALAGTPVYGSVTIQIISDSSRGLILDSTGAPLVDGSLMRVGFFDVEINDLTVSELLDPSLVEPLFTEFTSFSSSLGNFLDTDLNLLATNPLEQIYIWVFNASDPNLATEYGIFTSTGWTSPNDGGSLNMLSSEIDETKVGTTDESTPTNYLLTPVPEPAHFAVIFGLFGLGVVIWRRRR